MKLKIFMIFNFFELGFFIDLRAPSESRKLQVGVLEAMARDEGSRWGVFSAARARGDTIRTFCGSSVKFYFFTIFVFFSSKFAKSQFTQ